jgi:hypothetical protein
MLIEKLPLVIGIELLIMIVSFLIAKDSSQILEISSMLTGFVLVGAASIYFFKRR